MRALAEADLADQACERWREAMMLAGGDVETWLGVAATTSNPEEAARAVETAYKLNPGDERAIGAMERLRCSRVDPSKIEPPLDAFTRFDMLTGAFAPLEPADDAFEHLDSSLDAFAELPAPIVEPARAAAAPVAASSVPAPVPVAAAPVVKAQPVLAAPVVKPQPVIAASVVKPQPVAAAPIATPHPVIAAPAATPQPVVVAPVVKLQPVAAASVVKPLPVAAASIPKPEPVIAAPVAAPAPVAAAPVAAREPVVAAACPEPGRGAREIVAAEPEPVVAASVAEPKPVLAASVAAPVPAVVAAPAPAPKPNATSFVAELESVASVPASDAARVAVPALLVNARTDTRSAMAAVSAAREGMPTSASAAREAIATAVSAAREVTPAAAAAAPVLAPPAPVAPAPGGHVQAGVAAAPRNGSARSTVMVVDDSPTIRKILGLTLERAGYTVVAEPDGESAIERLIQVVPDLILLDIAMPKLDGYDVCKRIKQDPRTAGVPVVMLSGKGAFFDKVKGHMAGATEYLTKPFETPTVLAVVKTHCPAPVETVNG